MHAFVMGHDHDNDQYLWFMAIAQVRNFFSQIKKYKTTSVRIFPCTQGRGSLNIDANFNKRPYCRVLLSTRSAYGPILIEFANVKVNEDIVSQTLEIEY